MVLGEVEKLLLGIRLPNRKVDLFMKKQDHTNLLWPIKPRAWIWGHFITKEIVVELIHGLNYTKLQHDTFVFLSLRMLFSPNMEGQELTPPIHISTSQNQQGASKHLLESASCALEVPRLKLFGALSIQSSQPPQLSMTLFIRQVFVISNHCHISHLILY